MEQAPISNELGQTQTPVQPQPVPILPPKKSKLPLIVILLVAIVLIGVGGIYAVKRLGQPKVCTLEAKLCSDGSSVGRTGPNCEFAPCPTQVSSATPTPDETVNWKTYSNNDLSFKYPQNWNLVNARIEGSDPKVTIYIVDKSSTLMNECMQLLSTEDQNGVYLKRFSRVVTGEMCSTNDATPREIWIVPKKDSYTPGVSYLYSATEETQALAIFDQILSTLKFINIDNTVEGRFCGGIAANLSENQCPEGYECKLDGNYPDASGKCLKN